MTKNNRDLPNTAERQRKDSQFAQTAVLTRPGSELLQSCLELAACQQRVGWYVGLADRAQYKEYLHLSYPFWATTSFFND